VFEWSSEIAGDGRLANVIWTGNQWDAWILLAFLRRHISHRSDHFLAMVHVLHFLHSLAYHTHFIVDDFNQMIETLSAQLMKFRKI
jgi:hypothetical protein